MKAQLEELRAIVAARADKWDQRFKGPHDKGVHPDEEAYRNAMAGRRNEAQAILDLIDCLYQQKDISWGIPRR